MSGGAVGPTIPGLAFVRWLGSGGSGDVYLYENASLGRREAVKVSREADPTGALAERFQREVKMMGGLAHPHIVSVFTTGETGDGRPYLGMQYYSGGTLERRAEGGSLPVAKVLQTGVEIGSALETVHRTGIIHRDVKPANILVDEYGAVGLTDFGVAARIDAEASEEDVGVSIPWSPPEMLYTGTPGSPWSDIYSLGATLWHLLVGRSPFEVPGGDNDRLALMERVRTFPPPRTARADCPQTLEALLRSTLAKDPRQRPRSAADVVHSLQLIEDELRLPRSRSVIREPHAIVDPEPPPASATGTVARPTPRGGPIAGRVDPRPFDGTGGSMGGHQRLVSEPVEPRTTPATVLRPPTHEVTLPAARPPSWWRSRRGQVLLGSSALVLTGLVAVAARHDGRPAPASPVATTEPDALPVPDEAPPPGPVTVAVTRSRGKVTFVWTYERALTTDTYRLRIDGRDNSITSDTTFEVPAPETGTVCLSVIVVRADGSNPTRTFPKPTCG